MISRDHPADLATRLIDCFNTRQFEDAADLFDPGFVTHPFGTGAEEARQAWRLLVARFPDVRLAVDAVLVDGDTVTVRSTVEGVGVLAYGSAPVLIETFRTGEGRFVEWWGSTWLPDLS